MISDVAVSERRRRRDCTEICCSEEGCTESAAKELFIVTTTDHVGLGVGRIPTAARLFRSFKLRRAQEFC